MDLDNKMNLLDNVVNHLNLVPETLKLLPVGNKPMFDSSALVYGPGNVKEPKTSGTLLSWMIGCGQVGDEHLSTLTQVQNAAANGDMSTALGHNIVGWHVTNTRFQVKPRRRRAATATPTFTPPAPTKVVDVTSTQAIQSSPAQIMPTKTIDVQPTKMTDKPSTPTTTTPAKIQPSETTKMTQTATTPTTHLPTTSQRITTTVVTTPTSKPTTTPIPVTTPKPTTKPPTQAPTTTTTKTTPKPETTTKPSTQAPTTTTKTTPKPETPKVTPAPTTPKPLCPLGDLSIPPRVNNPTGDINIEAGEILRKKLNDDTFLDCYDLSTNNLVLEVLDINGARLSKDFFLTVSQSRSSKPYSFIANPLHTDVGVHPLRLSAMNSNNQKVFHSFTVTVHPSSLKSKAPSHELSMSIDTNFDDFMSDFENRIELSNKVATIFGDKNSRSLTVTRLERGSVVYAWTNNTVGSSGCPITELRDMVGRMFNNDGTLTDEAKEAMDPYTVTSAGAVPMGECENHPNFPSRKYMKDKPKPETTKAPTAKTTTEEKITIKPIPPIPTDEPEDTGENEEKSTRKPQSTTLGVAAAGAGSGGGSDIWITTVVPAIVVVIVLIIALTVACCLYRKKRRGKMKLREQNEYSQNKGVPVIFADEYDEKPNEASRPLIYDDEKPPVPPPGYQRAPSEGSGKSGNSGSTQHGAEEIEMDETDEMSPIYPPPPPVTGSHHNKPPHVQSSRGPPPYVPP
ncbi:hypothetical protein DPMN_121247 [Dreissena polymorpha]|uniref:Peptidase S72 domain-containing protein n=2 Tax=Dreissena polymorpha TaxID=45954 RepID=A0A9D4GQ54_DREPO|nr:hypothetical protein DPMN_121247 [Dreissena polymorpha]